MVLSGDALVLTQVKGIAILQTVLLFICILFIYLCISTIVENRTQEREGDRMTF